MRALVAVRGIDAGSDQRHADIPAGAPIGLGVRVVVRIDIDDVGYLGLSGQLAEEANQVDMIGAAGILGADRDAKLVRGLPFPDSRHVDGHELDGIRGQSRGCPVTELLVVAD